MKSIDAEKYLINGNILTGLAKLAVPIVLSSFTQNLMNLVDIYWLGKINKEMVAALSVSGIFFMLFTTLSVGVSTGAVAIVSFLFAKERMNDINICSLNMAIFSFLLGLIGGITGMIVAKPFFNFIGLKNEVLKYALSYTRIFLMGGWILLFNFLIISVLRGMGDSISAFKSLLLINVVNFFLDPLFIFGFAFIPSMKAEGAAFATVFGHIIGMIYLIRKGREKGILLLKGFRWNSLLVNSIVKIGFPASLRIGIRTLLNIIIVSLISGFGTAAIAAYGIGQKIIMVILIAGFSLGSAAATLVGQNLGAGKKDRAKKGIYAATVIYMLINFAFSILFFFRGEYLVSIFNNDIRVIEIGSSFLMILAPVLVINAAGIIVSRAIGGAGDTFVPAILNILIMICYQVPAAYLLSKKTFLGVKGVFIAEATALFFISIATILWFRTDSWLEKNTLRKMTISE